MGVYISTGPCGFFESRIAIMPLAGATSTHAPLPILRAACWATYVQVTRDERGAHMVTIDIIRRPGA